MAYITCKDVSLGYDGREIVEGLNFKVNDGDYLCIVGENGTGKSTLIRTMLHLKHPVKGTIEVGDGLNANEIGYLPQQTEVQRDFPATVWEIVLSGTLTRAKSRPFYSKVQKELAKSNMEKMGIWDLRKKSYRHLSGGQQQRALLARAMCAAEKVILLDEPITGLDPKAAADFYQLIRTLNKDGVTIIMVSHDVMAIQYATHILHVKRKNSFYGTVEEYMESPEGKLFQQTGGEMPW